MYISESAREKKTVEAVEAECHRSRLISHKLHGRTTSTKKPGQVDVSFFIGRLAHTFLQDIGFDNLLSSPTW